MPGSRAAKFNERLGWIFFAIYFVLYSAFVILCAFSPEIMESMVGPLNLALVFGFGLIGTAMLMALIYGILCRSETNGPQESASKPVKTGEASQG